LPALRGAAPANWAIIRGLKQTGVTVMYLAQKLDSGAILGQRETAIGPRETAGDLLDRLSTMGAELVFDVVARMASGTHQAAPQDERLVTYAPRLRKEDGLIDWSRSAQEIDGLVRGLHPWPGAFTCLGDMRIIIEQALPLEGPCPGIQPGQVIAGGRRLVVGTGSGHLELLSLKPQSRKAMTAEAFCNGHAVRPGTVFHSPPKMV
jgi:methionyl-tRNA formyltransferase